MQPVKSIAEKSLEMLSTTDVIIVATSIVIIQPLATLSSVDPSIWHWHCHYLTIATILRPYSVIDHHSLLQSTSFTQFQLHVKHGYTNPIWSKMISIKFEDGCLTYQTQSNSIPKSIILVQIYRTRTYLYVLT